MRNRRVTFAFFLRVSEASGAVEWSEFPPLNNEHDRNMTPATKMTTAVMTTTEIAVDLLLTHPVPGSRS